MHKSNCLSFLVCSLVFGLAGQCHKIVCLFSSAAAGHQAAAPAVAGCCHCYSAYCSPLRSRSTGMRKRTGDDPVHGVQLQRHTVASPLLRRFAPPKSILRGTMPAVVRGSTSWVTPTPKTCLVNSGRRWRMHLTCPGSSVTVASR